MDDQDELPPALERRMVLRLLHQWREAGGDEGIPRLEDIDREALSDVWQECYVLDVADAIQDTSFHSIGQKLIDQCGVDLSGQPISETPRNTLLYQSTQQLERVMKKGVPISMGGQFENADGRTVLFRCILLPLSDGEDNIKQLLGAANSRLVTEE